MRRNDGIFKTGNMASEILEWQSGIDNDNFRRRNEAWIAIEKPIFVAPLKVTKKLGIHVDFFGSASFSNVLLQSLNVGT